MMNVAKNYQGEGEYFLNVGYENYTRFEKIGKN